MPKGPLWVAIGWDVKEGGVHELPLIAAPRGASSSRNNQTLVSTTASRRAFIGEGSFRSDTLCGALPSHPCGSESELPLHPSIPPCRCQHWPLATCHLRF